MKHRKIRLISKHTVKEFDVACNQYTRAGWDLSDFSSSVSSWGTKYKRGTNALFTAIASKPLEE